MAVSDHLDDMSDHRLRPRMLRYLLRDFLPDEKRPSPSSAELSSVLSYVKTHGLLSEIQRHPADRRLVEAWRSSVDAWVDRLLSLVSNNMPDKCWVGICLLGVTCAECSSDRFLASYSLWFQKLLSNIQPPSSTHFVKVASCASLADLFKRLAYYSNLKKDATSLAGKIVQPVLQLLNEDGTEAVWEEALDLLCTLIIFFPSSLQRLQDNVEVVLVSKIMSEHCNSNMSKKFARCLALLPKGKGDENSWSLMMQKVLVGLNNLLADALQGLEEESKSSEIMRLLVPAGKDPPPPLGGQSMTGESCDQITKRLRKLVVPRVSALMHCCSIMLTNPYPVQVTVPVRPLLALVGRVLRVDGSLHDSLLSFTTATQQELLCSELPALHLASLDLLIAIINGVRSQLLPHAANIVRLLTEYFRRAALPSIRIKVYSIIQMLLISMGVGMALYLAQEVINNTFSDLNDSPECNIMPSNTYTNIASEMLVQGNRKRKHAFGSQMELSDGINIGAKSDGRRLLAPVSVKIAALGALEALLTVGGSLRSECWRSNVDLLLINVATNACDAIWANEANRLDLMEESSASRAEFQLAALQALLASLLSPTHVRPPHLSRGLELFRRGKQEIGTKVAAFCAHALLSLEVLIHPRALPVSDFLGGNISTFDEGYNRNIPDIGKKPKTPHFSRDGRGNINDLDDDDDILYSSWLENDEETAVDVGNLIIHEAISDQQPVQGLTENHFGEIPPRTELASYHKVAEENQMPVGANVEIQSLQRDQTMADLCEEPNNGDDSVGVTVLPVGVVEVDSEKGHTFPGPNSDEGAPCTTEAVMVEGKCDTILSDASTLDKDANDAASILVVKTKENGISPMFDSDTDSMDSLPEIVFGDPDSEDMP